MTLLESGRCETLKRSVHLGVGLLSGACFLYNLAAYAQRREPHLRRNAWFYFIVTAVEVCQVRRHCR